MVVQDVIPDLNEWEVQIIATDASTKALEQAKVGIYGDNSVRLVDAWHRDNYFIPKQQGRLENKLQLQEGIKKMVSLEYLNLIEDDFPANLDIIFCRNVFIYFDLQTILKIINKFHASLADNGYLFIGYSESLQFISEKFRMEDFADAIFYRKQEEGAVSLAAAPLSLDEETREVLADITLAETEASEKEFANQPVIAAENINQLLAQIIKCIYSKDYSGALDLIQEAKHKNETAPEPYYLSAEIFTNQGKFSQASNELKATLRINSFFAPAYYLSGSIYTQEEDFEKAKEAFKKTLYLDKDFILASLSLANIYRDEGEARQAIREYRNSLNILSKIPSNVIIPHSGGFNAATLTSVCRDNIERLKVEHNV